MKKAFLAGLIAITLLTSGFVFPSNQPGYSLSRQLTNATETAVPTNTPTATVDPALTLKTLTAISEQNGGIYGTPTVQWAEVETGQKVTVPILLYHHISDDGEDIRYYVDPEDFRIQMEMLKKLGYTTITIADLYQVIEQGGQLPNRPLVITFDDGDEDVYLNAYPIMKKLGMVGVFYIVANRLNLPGFVSGDEILELNKNGWEIGCHGMTHIDLKKDANLNNEMYQSRLLLEKELGIPIYSFAYPLGSADAFIMKKAMTYGYKNAVGLGEGYVHSGNSIYYLSRMEIRRSTSLENMLSMLPWNTP